MYGYPVSFREFSNREDFFQTVALNDDETGEPLNLAGILALADANGFSGSNWRVTDGTIVTTSSTPLTIPGYPIADELEALALTVGIGLNILQGDPVTIADNVDPANCTLAGYVTSYTPANGSLVVQVGYTFQFEVRHEKPRRGPTGGDYTPWWDWGTAAGDAPLIKASLGNGLTVVDLGVMLINIPEITMRQLHHRSYLTGLTATDGISTRQVFIARLPILYGEVTT